MRVFEVLLHFLTPRSSNNHRAKALHINWLTFYITILLGFQVFLIGVEKFSPEVLGYASNITVTDLLKYTNEKRQQAGVEKLVLSNELSAAAAAKATDMFANQYWAHNSPSGRDPWSFITEAGYTYLFAGENLARDFGDSRAVVEAWMNSASHRENLLNPRYQEVGFAVVNGKYHGYETTLVVQMFGTRPGGIPVQSSETIMPQVAVMEEKPATVSLEGAAIDISNQSLTPKIDVFEITKNAFLVITGGLIIILGIDGLLAYQRKVVRLSGHNFAHLIFLLVLLAALNLLRRGIIL